MANIKEARKKVEKKIYETFNILDPTGQNTEFYKHKFAKMSDTEFYTFFKQDFPLKFQTKIFEIDPKAGDIIKALDHLKVPVKSQEVLVVYLPLKRMKQMVQKKTGYSTEISKRDFRTGLLIDTDKNGNSTDREFESLVVFGMDNTLRELSTYRADSMSAKNKFYNQINTIGMVSQKDVEVENSDSIARNLISAYLLGCHINSNLVNIDCMLPRTIKRKNAGQKGLTRG